MKLFILSLLCLTACGPSQYIGEQDAADTVSIDPDASPEASTDAVADAVAPDSTDASDAATDTTPANDAAADQSFDDVPVCLGCFVGPACVESTVDHCGLGGNCNAPCTVANDTCQVPNCINGTCGVENRPDGTGCPGGECVGGNCVGCGSVDLPCCNHLAPDSGVNACNPGLMCVDQTRTEYYADGGIAHVMHDFRCAPCGGDGQSCCGAGDVSWSSPQTDVGGSCNSGLACNVGGTCTCGRIGETCCTGNSCTEGRCFADGHCGV
jgi:hypothetical protein